MASTLATPMRRVVGNRYHSNPAVLEHSAWQSKSVLCNHPSVPSTGKWQSPRPQLPLLLHGLAAPACGNWLLLRTLRRQRLKPGLGLCKWQQQRRHSFLAAAAVAAPTKVAVQTPLWVLKATNLLIFSANVCLLVYLTVFYDYLGLERRQMGLLSAILPLASFAGQLFWCDVVDRNGKYKLTLGGTSVVAVAVVFCYMLPCVRHSLWLLMAVTALHGFFAAPSGPLVDTLCLKVLAERNVAGESYGDLRLWSAIGWGGMAFAAGRLIDAFGINAIFYSFAALVLLNVTIIALYLRDGGSTARKEDRTPGKSPRLRKALQSSEAKWVIANLMMFGVLITLVDRFLNVFLLQDFIGTPKVLIGATWAVMCTFEIPVFMFVERVWKRIGLRNVLLLSWLPLALRCLLYPMLPRSHPWLVLFVEPLHGITFAAMWPATVECARRLALPGTEAKMQALLNGLYYQISSAIGCVFWGFLVRRPPMGLGFTGSFFLDAMLIAGWLAIFSGGLAVAKTRRF